MAREDTRPPPGYADQSKAFIPFKKLKKPKNSRIVGYPCDLESANSTKLESLHLHKSIGTLFEFLKLLRLKRLIVNDPGYPLIGP